MHKFSAAKNQRFKKPNITGTAIICPVSITAKIVRLKNTKMYAIWTAIAGNTVTAYEIFAVLISKYTKAVSPERTNGAIESINPEITEDIYTDSFL